jgi:hypothetical protein
MTKDEQLGDNNPPGDIVTAGATVTENITVTVSNGPDDLTMTMIGPASCNPRFSNPNDPVPNNVGGSQNSTITIPAANGTLTVQYQLTCQQPGDYCFQIIANIAAEPGDPNLANNQAENQVCAHVVLGTDVSVGVQKDENYNVDVSVDTTKPVVVTVNNLGPNAADVLVHITAISHIGQCEVRLIPHPGDTYSEYFTDEVVGPPNPDTLTSQVEFTIPAMPANSSLVFIYDYVIHCFQKSFHNPAFELQVDAIPLAPVFEQNLGGDPITDPTNPHNNVEKNFPSVTAYDNADLQKSGCTLSSPATVAGGTNFTVTSTCTLTNNGPAVADFSDQTILTLPSDCAIMSGANPQTSTATLPNGGSTAISATWTVTCTNPSDHTFTANDTVTVTTLHVKDPHPNNNSGSASSTTAITTTGDPSVSGVAVTSPASVNVGQHFTVAVSETVAGLNPSFDGTAVFTLSGPADCTQVPNGGQSLPAANGPLSASWDVVCTGQSDHAFTGTNTLVLALPNHVSDSNPDNNFGSANSTTAVIAHANLAISITGVPASTEVGQPPSSATISPAVTVSNTGDPVHVTWTVTASGTGAAPCTVGSPASAGHGPVVISPNATSTDSFTLTLPSGHECTYEICVTAAATAVHETGTATTCANGALQSNVLVEKYLILVGPAAVNLSDTNGRYLWLITEIGNVSSDTELAHIDMSILEPVPTGCTRTQSLVLPGQQQFLMAPGEQKIIVWRVRYECHAPATAQVINQTVTVGVTHCDPTTTNVPNGPNTPGGPCTTNSINEGPSEVETILNDNAKTTTKQVILQ